MRSTLHHPIQLIPAHRVTDPHLAAELTQDIARRGWVGDSLIGYQTYGVHIQLLTGTHRHAACDYLGVWVPVKVYPNSLLTRTLGRLRYWQCRLQGKL